MIPVPNQSHFGAAATQPARPARIIALIVIYKMRPTESPTLRTLMAAAREASPARIELEVLVADNTPGGQEPGDLPAGMRYEPAPHNPGLAAAYNRALEIADSEGYDWMLTLDQDTLLPGNFLARVAELAASLDANPAVGAIVPQILGDGRNISPFRFSLGAIPMWFPLGFTGLVSAAYAVNSAATVRVAAVREIGGYDPMFPLDVSDLHLFHRLHLAGRSVFVAGDLLVAHDYSILEKDSRMSKERYRSLLLDECAFWDMHMGVLGRMERLARLGGRLCKDLAKPGGRIFCRLTAAELARRLTTFRSRRVAEWKQWASARALANAGAASAPNPSRGASG